MLNSTYNKNPYLQQLITTPCTAAGNTKKKPQLNKIKIACVRK